ncbi:hypothetical protein [Clostridium massiliamazoniense]|uniref:hypothetical protein n=1 Tax=Clostridium massiliamazoniense TaxID=1347366 RepID=UPI0006D775F1|nr:hypothetical protein [Clostridium massiliamazoniense]
MKIKGEKNKEEEKFNKGLENYKKRKFKEDFMKIYEDSKSNKPVRAILFIDEKMNESKYYSEASYSCKLTNNSFQLFGRNLITNAVLKPSREIPFEEINNVKLSIGNSYETKAMGIYPRYDYEGKEEEIRFRNDGRLSIEITLINGEVIRILTGNIRESFIYVKKILEENRVRIIDEYNLDKVLLEKNDKEMYEYINNCGKF